MGWREALGIGRRTAPEPDGDREIDAGEEREERAREASLAEEDRGWRAIAGPGGPRDVAYGDLLESIRDAAEAYRVNPLAYRIVELTSDHVLGQGMRLRAESAEAQAFLDAFWEANRMGTRQFDMCTELSLAGELFVTLHTNPFDGMTYIRCIPAAHIDRVETNPEDIEDERRFHQVGGCHSEPPGEARNPGGNPAGTPRFARSDMVGARSDMGFEGEASLAPTRTDAGGRWWTAEECRHYAINRLVGAVRGQGDLAPLLPWLRRYKDWLTDRVRINKFKGAFLWDVRLEGASERAILARQAQLVEPPSPGSVLVHNEREEWRAVQPQIDAQAAEPDGKAMRLMLAAGAGIPLHYLAEAEDTNRATAESMAEPTLRHFARRQRYFGWLMADLAGEALRRSGRFGGGVEARAEFGGLEAGSEGAKDESG